MTDINKDLRLLKAMAYKKASSGLYAIVQKTLRDGIRLGIKNIKPQLSQAYEAKFPGQPYKFKVIADGWSMLNSSTTICSCYVTFITQGVHFSGAVLNPKTGRLIPISRSISMGEAVYDMNLNQNKVAQIVSDLVLGQVYQLWKV